MAYTSGSISANVQTSGSATRTLIFKWTLTSQSEANNKSNIHWTLTGGGTNDGNGYTCREVRAKINGTQVYYKGTDAYSLRYNAVMAQGDTTITHNSDGDANIILNLETAHNQWLINVSKSNSWALPKIKRASSISCETFTLGTEGTITVTKENSSFTHKITYLFGDTSETGLANGKGIKGIIYEGSDTDVKWTPPIEDFALIIPTKTSAQGSMICETFASGKSIGSKNIVFTVKIPTSVKPTLIDAHYEFDNSANDTIKNVWKRAVQGFTKIKLIVGENEATGIYGSTITKFEITGEYADTVASDTLSYTGSVINSFGSKTFSIVAVDSRGRKSNKKTFTIQFLEYSNPFITGFTIGRNQEKSNDLDLFFNATYSTVAGLNKLTCVLNYKKRSTNTWRRYGEVESGKTVTISDDPKTPEVEFEWYASYDINLVITDSLGNTFAADGFVPTLSVTYDAKAGGNGFAFGKTSEIENAFEISDRWDFYAHGKEIKELIFESIYPVGSIYSTVSSENPGVTFGFGQWEQWGSGKVPIGVDANSDDFSDVEATGGKTEYKLSAAIGAINNTQTTIGYIKDTKTKYQEKYDTHSDFAGSSEGSGYAIGTSSLVSFERWNHSTVVVEHDSDDRNVKIIPPYITCYMWKRIS